MTHDKTRDGKIFPEIISKGEHLKPTSPEVSLTILTDETIRETSKTSRKCCQNFQVPITVIFIQIALGICCILEWGIWNTDEGKKKYRHVKGNAFGAAWFNIGGVLGHYLPNAILGFFTGWLIEWNVGTLNMVFVWFWGYFFAIGYKIALNGGIVHTRGGWGFSLQLFHWFTVAGGALFLRFWWFSEGRNKKLTSKQILWWLGGIFILIFGGWLGNIGVLTLEYFGYILELYHKPCPFCHHGHNVANLYGYAGVILLSLVLWWQSSYFEINRNISSTFHHIEIVWITGMYSSKRNITKRWNIKGMQSTKSDKKTMVIITVAVTLIVLIVGCGLMIKVSQDLLA